MHSSVRLGILHQTRIAAFDSIANTMCGELPDEYSPLVCQMQRHYFACQHGLSRMPGSAVGRCVAGMELNPCRCPCWPGSAA